MCPYTGDAFLEEQEPKETRPSSETTGEEEGRSVPDSLATLNRSQGETVVHSPQARPESVPIVARTNDATGCGATRAMP